ncbi:MAG TPA: hypothetical protein VLQ93_13075 [Myxococcaceae bacterium]|nr:hypothetical protein [Myxococcaceae bacterium]
MAPESQSSPRFFVLEDGAGGSHDTEFTRLGDNVGEAPRCPQCGDIIGKRSWLPPYRVTLELYGEDFADFIKGFGPKLLVTERFADAFRAEGLTGFQGFQPVDVAKVRRQRHRPKPPNVPRYFYVTPAFGSAAVDEAHSRIQRSEPISCDWCRMTGVDAIQGFALEPESWSGEDVFIARGLPGTLIVSERFARFAAAHGLTHMRLTPTEQYAWDPRAPRPPPPTPLGQA